MPYCLYVRKSRADAEAEARGEGETLTRHINTLLALAKRRNIEATQIYREIVSGETIAARPVMQQLLSEVEQGIWDGVLVMEVERLARGDTVDQGIVAQTFKLTGTKIITPVKDYDPNNEYDEEYFEFGLFMSRREYKTINRRLQRGRITSVQEGKYLGSTSPYGYERVKIKGDSGYTLAPLLDEAEVVKLIYNLYTIGEPKLDGTFSRIGTALIARHLNEMGIKPRKGDYWVHASIRDILINPVYTGHIRWNWRKTEKHMVDGHVTKSRPRAGSDSYILVKGLHPAIISQDIFDMAQEYMMQNPPAPVPPRSVVKSPLAGLVVCSKCGRKMVRRPYADSRQMPTLMCPAQACGNVSSALPIVEERILKSLREWLNEYKIQWLTVSKSRADKTSLAEFKRKALTRQQTELDALQKQLDKAYDLLEQGVYDTDTFLDRSRSLSERIRSAKSHITIIRSELEDEIIREKSSASIVPKIERLLEVYHELPDAKTKNDMLKDVLEKVVYTKAEKAQWHGSLDNFEIVIYPKVPKKQQNGLK